MLRCRTGFAAVVTLALLTAAASAQSGRANMNSAAAVLHISVTVAPVLHAPVAAVVPRAEGVSYMVPEVKTQQEARVELVPLRGLKERIACVAACDGLLRTTTVVAK